MTAVDFSQYKPIQNTILALMGNAALLGKWRIASALRFSVGGI
jgi:hypothetical protein